MKMNTMQKVVIFLHAEPGTHDALGRCAHALLYALELHEQGVDVHLIFDGGGTKWIPELLKKDHLLNPLYRKVEKLGIIDAVCDYCISAFDVERKTIEQANLSINGDYQGHPSLASYVLKGYQIICL
jgi:hypothetical protein